MIKEKYISIIADIKNKYFSDKEVFIFGSCLGNKKFRDVDIAVIKNKKSEKIINFKEDLEKSSLPYIIDIVDFNTVNEDFKEKVLKEKILWL